MLQLKNISWELPTGEKILDDVSLTIKKGKLTVITGPNGGGKTSLAKIVAGLISPSHGEIFFEGENITKMDTTKRAQKGISYAFQQPVRFKGLSVRDLLSLSTKKDLKDTDYCELLGSVGLCTHDYIDREVNSSLSGGEIKRIEIATVLARNTTLSVFDEPEAGIDLWSFTGLIDVFQKQKNKGNTMLIISHQERILNIADEIIVIADGKVRKTGNKDEVLPELLESEKANHCPLGKEVSNE